ncbi:hypothetical protein ACOSQ2_020397 [Xanthoceras sorbifolium]
MRHLLGLIVEVGVAFYVFVRFWNSNNLTNLAIPVLITGMVYRERTWALWSSSTQRYKDCLDLSPDLLKQGIDKEDHNLVEAYYSYKRLKYLFANQIINENKYHNYSIISEKTAADAFNLVAIELALMYDVLYTKATVVYSLFGISFLPLPDITVTYLLIVGAVLLEIYAFMVLFSSDWTKLWLVKFKVASHNHIPQTRVNNFWSLTSCLHSLLTNKKRRSESMGQYNLMNSASKKRQHIYFGLDTLSSTSELLDKYQYLTWQDVDITLHDTIFKYLKEKVNGLHQPRTFLQSFKKTLDELLSKSGEDVLKRYGYNHPLVDEEYDAKIIIWHINVHKGSKNLQISKQLSDYMLYLLLFRPSMLLKGIGEIRYEHTFLHTERYYEARPYKHKLRANKGMTSNIIPHSVFEQAENLASELKCDDADGLENTWEMISEVWLEMLTFAAQNCEWKEHAQHLRKGGELLTHVSVLMLSADQDTQLRENREKKGREKKERIL